MKKKYKNDRKEGEKRMADLEIRATDLVLSKKELSAMLKCSLPTLQRLMTQKDFPKPFRLVDSISSSSLWRLEDIREWIDKRAKNTNV